MRTLKVTGKGSISLAPDVVRLSLKASGIKKEYSETLALSSEEIKELQKVLTKLNFDPKDLKTWSFNVNSKYKTIYHERSSNEQIFLGYEYERDMKLEFPLDNERLGKVLYALAHSKVSVEISISYTISDTEKAKDELLKNAIIDSKRKAQILALSSEVTLGEIQSIDYSWATINFETRDLGYEIGEPMEECRIGSAPSYDIDVEPEDIKATDTVTVTWEIL